MQFPEGGEVSKPFRKLKVSISLRPSVPAVSESMQCNPLWASLVGTLHKWGFWLSTGNRMGKEEAEASTNCRQVLLPVLDPFQTNRAPGALAFSGCQGPMHIRIISRQLAVPRRPPNCSSSLVAPSPHRDLFSGARAIVRGTGRRPRCLMARRRIGLVTCGDSKACNLHVQLEEE